MEMLLLLWIIIYQKGGGSKMNYKLYNEWRKANTMNKNSDYQASDLRSEWGVGSRSLLQGLFTTQGSNQVSHIAGTFFTS